MPDQPTLDELIAMGERATSRPWWGFEDCGDYQIVIGDQEDRVCECHNEECKPKENCDYIVAACNAAPTLAKRVKELEAENAELRKRLAELA